MQSLHPSPIGWPNQIQILPLRFNRFACKLQESYSFENHCAHSFSHSSILRECEYCVNACQRGECVEMQFRAWKLDEYVDTAVSNGKLNNRIDEGGGCLIEREGELRTGSAQYWISLANVGGPGSKWIHEYSCACQNFKCLKSLKSLLSVDKIIRSTNFNNKIPRSGWIIPWWCVMNNFTRRVLSGNSSSSNVNKLTQINNYCRFEAICTRRTRSAIMKV